MRSKRVELVIKKVVDELSSKKGVAALVLVGSQVEGNKFPPDEFSDIEVYVVAFDEAIRGIEKRLHKIQEIFRKDDVVLAYQNQWAGWSILFTDLLRLELPLVKASDDTVFSRPSEQKIEVLYSKPGFSLKRGLENKVDKDDFEKDKLEIAIKDFWYMAVYAAQHIGRGEVWLARDAIRISMQGKVKRLLQEIYHKDTLALDRDRRIELTWGEKELKILRETSSAYDKKDVIRSFWANIKYAESLLEKLGVAGLFREYKDKLTPAIKEILERRG